MNWKLKAGQVVHALNQSLIKTDWNFINNNYPYGHDWMFDVKRILRSANLIIDAGANVGDISNKLHSWFPDAYIHAFEPVSSTYNILTANCAAKSNISLHKKALGATTANQVITLNSEHTINSLKATPLENRGEQEQIEIIRLDDFILSYGLSTIDILKIDVEGYELEVLDGCGSHLAHTKAIYIEVGYEREAAKVHFSDMEIYMEQHGFQLCGIYETRRSLHDRRKLWYSNNLYINKNLLV